MYYEVAGEKKPAEWYKKGEQAGVNPAQLMHWSAVQGGIKADKDANGKTISGSRKAKVIKALNMLGLSQKEYLLYLNAAGYEK